MNSANTDRMRRSRISSATASGSSKYGRAKLLMRYIRPSCMIVFHDIGPGDKYVGPLRLPVTQVRHPGVVDNLRENVRVKRHRLLEQSNNRNDPFRFRRRKRQCTKAPPASDSTAALTTQIIPCPQRRAGSHIRPGVPSNPRAAFPPGGGPLTRRNGTR